MNYIVRWPIHGQNFNSRDYPSVQMILDDIETIIRSALEEKLDIKWSDFKVGRRWSSETEYYYIIFDHRTTLSC